MADVAQGRGQPEQGAEHVLALGNPGYRIHIDGMQGEQRRRQSRAETAAQQAPQKKPEQHDVCGVNQQAVQVMPAGMLAEQGDIGQVG